MYGGIYIRHFVISFDFLQRSRCITGYRVMQARNTDSITGIACAQSLLHFYAYLPTRLRLGFVME